MIKRIILVLVLFGFIGCGGPTVSSEEEHSSNQRPDHPLQTRNPLPVGEVALPPLEMVEQDDGTLEADITSEALFDINSAELKAEAQEIVNQLGQNLAAGSYHVRVDGFTDGLGAADYNFQLSLERAESLAQAIVNLGTAQHVQACGRGEEGTDGESDDPSARRVVITLSTQPFQEDCS